MTSASAPPPSPEIMETEELCPAGHQLQKFQTPSDKHTCDLCGNRFSRGATMYGCRPCDFDACCKCQSAKESPHGTAPPIAVSTSISDGSSAPGRRSPRSPLRSPLMGNREPRLKKDRDRSPEVIEEQAKQLVGQMFTPVMNSRGSRGSKRESPSSQKRAADLEVLPAQTPPLPLPVQTPPCPLPVQTPPWARLPSPAQPLQPRLLPQQAHSVCITLRSDQAASPSKPLPLKANSSTGHAVHPAWIDKEDAAPVAGDGFDGVGLDMPSARSEAFPRIEGLSPLNATPTNAAPGARFIQVEMLGGTGFTPTSAGSASDTNVAEDGLQAALSGLPQLTELELTMTGSSTGSTYKPPSYWQSVADQQTILPVQTAQSQTKSTSSPAQNAQVNVKSAASKPSHLSLEDQIEAVINGHGVFCSLGGAQCFSPTQRGRETAGRQCMPIGHPRAKSAENTEVRAKSTETADPRAQSAENGGGTSRRASEATPPLQIQRCRSAKGLEKQPKPVQERFTADLVDVFGKYCERGKNGMAGKDFTKICLDAFLLKDRTDADLIFSQVMRGERRMDFEHFESALEKVADRRLEKRLTGARDRASEILNVRKQLARLPGPNMTGTTVPYEVRLHDDQTTYTGVFAQHTQLQSSGEKTPCNRENDPFTSSSTSDNWRRSLRPEHNGVLRQSSKEGNLVPQAQESRSVSPGQGLARSTSPPKSPATVITADMQVQHRRHSQFDLNSVKPRTALDNLQDASPGSLSAPVPKYTERTPRHADFPSEMDLIEQTFKVFSMGKAKMDGRSFVKLCEDCHLIDSKLLTKGVCDIIFVKASTSEGKKWLDVDAFIQALELVAKQKGMGTHEVLQTVAAQRSAKPTYNNTTKADNVRFHDDKSTYTGTHKENILHEVAKIPA